MRIPAFAVFAATAGTADGFLRRLATGSSSSLPSNESFVFDGTNSDIAQQLYIRHQAGDTDDAVTLNSVPTAVTARLDPFNIDFSDLPGLVQRAVLWDTGFAISPSNDAVQIWTMEDYSMADIAIPKSDVAKVDCTFLNCTQPDDVTAYYSQYCTGYQMLNVSRCVVDLFEDPSATTFMGMMWSMGGDPDMAPQIRLLDHSWSDKVNGTWTAFSVYVVHTVPKADDPAWNVCPADDGYASLTVPCHRRDQYSDAQIAAMNKPTGSAWVTTWLQQEFAQDSSFNLVLLVPIILGVLVVVGAIGGWFWWRRRAKRRQKEPAADSYEVGVQSPYYMVATPDLPTTTVTTNQSMSSHLGYESAGSNKTLKILLGSEHLMGKRVPYESLAFERALSKGASGEVWICALNGQTVAVKRLLQSKTQSAAKVQAFAEEIELSASLNHPHIVAFVGVAWNTLNNLVMVLEFLPQGDLQSYLHKNADLLSWARDKIHMALGVAQALEYLHHRTPPLIHRDLKSNNILLTDKLEPKLIDFGVSRDRTEVTMTAGVGTPYWTAPEILEGKRYTEQADVYSFGVVLSELDTCRIPYADAVTEDGGKALPFQILQDVMSGTLRPTFSDDCPPRIKRIGLACLALDPATRPTATELINELKGEQ